MIQKSFVKQVADYCKIMGDEQRLKILRILASNMKNTVTVSDIAQILDISQPAVSRHLKLLADFGILFRKKSGPNVFYSLNEEIINKYQNLIMLAWERGHKPCNHGFKCDTCPNTETCV
ncbi:hypothetical protein AT727_05810 [Desulfitobacterium hafniense]|uniref:HTH arsR-type domain-containing protein n=1 Tax=Desulfitobacterium hafniense TaxID=49338 RepID=A0A0W1JHE3_DESHA|nr:metalloregulator ArsR/SmtB family transcription factor [Desulfitobacterium hafniense]KTE91113.1 hypothetical protein AT727_05810 [Desulfitobacterium hafniense]